MTAPLMARYAVELARKNSEAVSFIPAPRVAAYAEAGQLLVEHENHDPCGFLIYGVSRQRTAKVYQACVQYDARRREHGMRLVVRLVAAAVGRGCQAISLWCADDLDANDFWRAAGFQWAGQRAGGQRRGRRHNKWVLWLPSTQSDLFTAHEASA